MKRWRSTRFLSLILVLAMLFQMLPVQSLAATDDESTAVAVEEGQHEVSVLGEVEELREEDTKHFRLSDGSFVAVSYLSQGIIGIWIQDELKASRSCGIRFSKTRKRNLLQARKSLETMDGGKNVWT